MSVAAHDQQLRFLLPRMLKQHLRYTPAPRLLCHDSRLYVVAFQMRQQVVAGAYAMLVPFPCIHKDDIDGAGCTEEWHGLFNGTRGLTGRLPGDHDLLQWHR